jgi:hypothetical protein
VKHSLQTFFRYREGDKVQRPFSRFFLVSLLLLTGQVVNKLTIGLCQGIAVNLRFQFLLQLFVRMLT